MGSVAGMVRMRLFSRGWKELLMVLRPHAVITAMFLLLLSSPLEAGTLEDVRKAGAVKCGMQGDVTGFSSKDGNKPWAGMNIDFCRAIAAAVLGSADKAEMVDTGDKDGVGDLRSGTINVMFDSKGWTITRDTLTDAAFAVVSYYDGQGFMAGKALGISSALELSGASVCLKEGSVEAEQVLSFFGSRKMRFEAVAVDEGEDVYHAYSAGRCDVYSANVTKLYADRLKLSKPDDHIVFPEVVSRKPLGIYVRRGDDRWLSIVRWTLFAMINAEELAVTSDTAASQTESKAPAVRKLLGTTGDLGSRLGLDKDWAFRIIQQVGNYGEVFGRNLGPQSELKIMRGINALWNKGGILYAPPIR